jgi:undecaprenyl diphosphate synthase
MIQHLALIMDGNRRWAKKQNLITLLGHKQGIETVKQVLEFCLEKAIKTVSLYTFSLENFKRSPQEIKYLFNLIVTASHEALPQLIEQGIRITFVGNNTYFPEHVKPIIEHLETTTKKFTQLHVNILFCYGARQEILQATKHIAQEVKAGLLDPEQINPEVFKKYLWGAAVPDPELIIRTGGVKRLSNFLLYQAAYSELYFTDVLWPDLNKQELSSALAYYNEQRRNFGT